MRPRPLVFIPILFLGLTAALSIVSWLERVVETSETVRSGSKELAIVLRVQKRIYAALPHMAGWYLSKGKTQVEITSGSWRWSFDTNEELDLIGAHVVHDRVLLLFDSQYRPERGFLAFQAPVETSFTSLALNQVPPKLAFPNVGQRGRVARAFFDVSDLGAVPPDGFYDSATAWLWSQIKTNTPVLDRFSKRLS